MDSLPDPEATTGQATDDATSDHAGTEAGHAPSGPTSPDGPPPPDGPSADLDADVSDVDRHLLERARGLGDLDLADRPDAFERLDRQIVAELRAIEDL